MKLPIAVTTAWLMFSAASAFADKSLNFEPGMWETHINVKVEGMPMALPPQSYKRCATADDIARQEDVLIHPASQDPDQKCEVKQYEHKGNTISMHLVCSGNSGPAEFRGKIIIDSKTAYHGGFDGEVTTEMGPMKMHQTISGKRTGKCS